MESNIIICGASRGEYSESLTFRDAYRGKLPKTAYCNRCDKQHSIENLKVFRWELTPQEREEAIRDFDMFSLDMPDRILCLGCIDKEKVKDGQWDKLDKAED